MAVNKVNFGGNTLIDLTGDTLESAEQLLKGIIAHAKDGSVITGLMEAGGGGGKVSFASGTVTFESDTTLEAGKSSIKITHGLGCLPIAFYMYAGSSSSTYKFRFLSMILNATNVNNDPRYVGLYFTLERYNTSTSQNVSRKSSLGYSSTIYWNDTFILPFHPNIGAKIQAGVDVNWFVVGVEGATA